MSRLLKPLILLTVLVTALSGVSAQSNAQLKQGDPPVEGRISISPPDEDGIVTISGAADSVFPAAQVAVRNLYTGQTVYVQAGVTGTFTATIYGPGNTPFWISPSTSIPNSLRDRPGSLPGGPGTIKYGTFAQTAADPAAAATTQLIVDGDAADWSAYPNSAFSQSDGVAVYSLVNQNSIYVGLTGDALPTDYTQLTLTFTLDGALYTLSLDPRQQQLAALSRVQPNPRENIATLPVAASQGQAIELRIPTAPIEPTNPSLESATLENLVFVGADGNPVLALSVQQSVPLVAERDGIVRLNSQIGSDLTRFTISGALAGGSSVWSASGRINQLAFEPGETLVMELDAALNTPELPDGLVGLRMIGQIGLQPVVGTDGAQTAGGLDSNNGWSDVLTPSGLAISGLRGDFVLGEAVVPANQVIRQGEQIVFPLDFNLTIPDDLPAGMYVPFFRGFLQVGDGEILRWDANGPLGSGEVAPSLSATRLPVVLNVGGVTGGRLLWTLFNDVPSNGSRGVLALEDQQSYALANRVRFDSPTYILPPTEGPGGDGIAYPIEPYLLNQMPNTYDRSTAPLVPFLFPGGRMDVRITRPDGQVDTLGGTALVQAQLSTPTLDERSVFGAQSPVDIYRLTTLNPIFGSYVFTQYGQYEISMTGGLEDIWGNRYEGGGTYRVLIAETLDLLPGVLPGTPFEVGDAFYPGLHIAPGAPAEVTIRVRIYPLDGGAVIEQVIEGQANNAGHFHADDQGLRFETAGEYVIDYEARYTDADGRLWAGSLRSAGVIARTDGTLLAHGARGLDSLPESGPAWFSAEQYAPGVLPRLNFPYHSGDVAWLPDGLNGQIRPIIQAQDVSGSYADWLLANLPPALNVQQRVVDEQLPVAQFSAPDDRYGPALQPDGLLNDAYAYISAVLPGVTARQFVDGGLASGLDTYWDADDPFNQQHGAGVTGSRPGDFVFLFGGAVVRNEQAGVRDTAAYAALAIITDGISDTLGTRVFPPYRGEAGGPNGGPLLVLRDEEINMFFHPTGVRPGDVLRQGDTLSVAGQVAPTLASLVSVQITAPSGVVRQFEGKASAIGYFYDPTQDFAVDEPGVWTVDVRVRHEGLTSAGSIEPPPPIGNVLGSESGRFMVYVLPNESQPLEWNDARADFTIPPGIPYNFSFPLPETWTDVQVFHTVSIPGSILSQGPLRPSGRSFSFQYNPTNLGRSFPNLETNGQGEGPSAADVMTLTFVVTGSDENGRFQVRARTFTIMHDRLTTFG